MPADDRSIPLFPEALAELKQVAAGQPYRPGNGTEGDIFTATWCGQCAKSYDEEFGIRCPIYLQSLVGHVDQWIIDSRGQPKCTEFEEVTCQQ